MEEAKSLKDIINYEFDKNRDKVAFIEQSFVASSFEEIKYSKVKDDIVSLGTSFYEDSSINGKKIAVIGENSSRWFITYMAVICGAGIVVPLDKELSADEIVNLINRADIKVIVYSNKNCKVIDKVKTSINKDIQYIKMYRDNINSDRCLDDLYADGKNLISKGCLEYINKKINPEVFSALMFTSGASDMSKGVMLSHKNLIFSVKSIISSYKELAGKRFISFLPMHHIFEFMITYLSVLISGGTVGICRDLKFFMSDLKAIKPECMCLVPLMLENMKKKTQKFIKKYKLEKLMQNVSGTKLILSRAGNDLRRKLFGKIHDEFGGKLKYLFCGGASLANELGEYMELLGFIVIEGYGLTEASSLISATKIKNCAHGTVGTAIDNVELRIDLKDSVQNSGEIIVKGDNVMLGYFENEEETKKVLRKGWLYTGDLGRFDSKGNLVITGKSKDVIITSSGRSVYPQDLEARLNKIPFVNESMVYGYVEKGATIICARVSLNEDYISEKYKDNRPSDAEIYNMIFEYIKSINCSIRRYSSIKKLEIVKGSTLKNGIRR